MRITKEGTAKTLGSPPINIGNVAYLPTLDGRKPRQMNSAQLLQLMNRKATIRFYILLATIAAGFASRWITF